MKIQRYGWVRDIPDQRDFALVPQLIKLPKSVDLRPSCPPVYDQGQLGSCTANAIAGAAQFMEFKERLTYDYEPSQLFIYYNERVIEGTVASDAGAQIRDGIKSVAVQGYCPETDWPYDITQFAVTPSALCYADALQHRVSKYERVSQAATAIKTVLATEVPVVFGFTVYESFESDEVAKTGIVPMPTPAEAVLGGHAVVAVGYDDAKKWFIVRNSWGSGWGDGGYCYMPYTYLSNKHLASDFWAIQVTT